MPKKPIFLTIQYFHSILLVFVLAIFISGIVALVEALQNSTPQKEILNAWCGFIENPALHAFGNDSLANKWTAGKALFLEKCSSCHNVFTYRSPNVQKVAKILKNKHLPRFSYLTKDDLENLKLFMKNPRLE